ncbi:alpha/beta fold hydrolase [Deinococcus metallilatus]|uniref:Alpha/beta fold hydrolase n=1 Tax=Deinococcus metallilatus TaxID=1211322 RepID=A0AAJ5JYH9_9DEIO|nr:alpha/beta hydrolase [Deinococcus metallilatus]MBB5295508.1 pimeloyl-ACP methyl ester carboxylesterase [Deinococcus metallilatus]QBY07977.1 alpha/beta fold hydrolase [Deinococcus metallilatus]RXJ12870.1 alpha/beta fold hydrolase [Deinococcus metallilatus]TLK27208.1 alpha/beta fold hydrolase [Deinococcus metallilatus]GMA16186.1 beta-ketoadipate enol-lactone hydrolase [Deinococcus metallilatus]
MTEGRPRTVLFLHAYPLSAAMWEDQKAALEAAGLTVLAPNLPGFGGEEGAITSLADTARDLLKTLPPDPTLLVGLSMGGYLALELLAQAPERFARAVLADTSARADDEEKQKDRRQQAERVLKEGKGFIIEAAREEHRPETFTRIRPMIEAATPQGIAGALRAMAARPDQRDTLRRLNLPLLALVGEQDDLTPPDLAGEIAELGHGERQIIPGAMHLSNLEAPEAFSAALLAFLR